MCPNPYPKSLTCHSSPVSDFNESNSTGAAWSDDPAGSDEGPGVASAEGNDPNWNATSGFVLSITPILGSPTGSFVLGVFRNSLLFVVTVGSSRLTPTVKDGSRGSMETFPVFSSTTLTTSSVLGTDGSLRPKIICGLEELVDKAAATSR